MPDRSTPYIEYAYVIYRIPAQGVKTLLGGFTAAAGLPELPIRRYEGTEELGRVQGTYTANDVTMKRGLVNATELLNWIAQTRTSEASAVSEMIVTLRNETGTPIISWQLTNALPLRYTGPLTDNQDEAALEELILSCQSIQRLLQ
ncbi:phage tail protein [Terracidiphilus gabretensis]|uniref:phage tail protein n=1 Tax=Terracidiphilus gabretensis TaxID=1577687 RepID=UPI00071B4D64|nr:phage tail protein [Terracidiphilus gabretensis]